MHIVVCIKQVPDSAQIRVHPVTNTIMRQGVPTIINPYDLFALEAALRLRDKHQGTITVLTMGPPMAEESLRRALSFGPDRAVLLTDRAFAGSDTLATSYALANAIRQIGESFGAPDIVFTGKQTSVAAMRQLDLDAGKITVERRAEGGVQVLTTKLPCLITMLEGTNEIRRGSIDVALAAVRAEIVTWNAASAGITDLARCGLKGSPTVVKKVFAPAPRSEKAFRINPAGGSDALASAAIDEIFKRLPMLERELIQPAQG